MSLVGNLRVLRHLARGTSGPDHATRLERFYGPQADDYDAFREKLLHGRRELIEAIPLPEHGGRYAEFGGGTGRNLEFLDRRLDRLAAVDLVDLCPSLLAVARRRCRQQGWSQVGCYEADITRFRGAEAYDAIVCSYALSMVPDWFSAIDNAVAQLRPGGHLGVVDFYISRAHPARGRRRHSSFDRTVWPLWFRRDGVHLREDLLPYLCERLDPVLIHEASGRLPFTPFRVPYLRFLGRRRSPSQPCSLPDRTAFLPSRASAP